MAQIKNQERIERLKEALAEAELDALVCTLPSNVLLLSGYWPVIGNAIAIFTVKGEVAVLAPEDEKGLAENGWANQVQSFRPGSLDELINTMSVISPPLTHLARDLGLERSRIGYESDALIEPVTYASMFFYGPDVYTLLDAAFPNATLVSATNLLEKLRATLTPYEVAQVRTACQVAARAFQEGAARLHPGLRESEVAACFREPLSAFGMGYKGVERAGGFVWCMSGPRSAKAAGAFARTEFRELREGDFVLMHCNSYIEGFWTDITRTFVLGEPEPRKCEMYQAVFEARKAALEAIRPGVRAADVDLAARQVLKERGFEKEFKHSTGHGVGYVAIDHTARPRLHPKSEDVLGVGMVFNVEPAIYFDNYGGLRHCDVVTVTETGVEVLTSFQNDLKELIISK